MIECFCHTHHFRPCFFLYLRALPTVGVKLAFVIQWAVLSRVLNQLIVKFFVKSAKVNNFRKTENLLLTIIF
jgi:hypothetical protein